MIVLKFLVLLGGVVAARTSNGDYCHSCLNVNVDLGDPEHCMNVTKQTEVAEMDRGCYQMTGTYSVGAGATVAGAAIQRCCSVLQKTGRARCCGW